MVRVTRNKTRKTYYKISEISRQTGVPAQTIHYYLREGLLPPPVKTSKTMAYYTDAHLERLYFIKKYQIEAKQGLKEIKNRLEEQEDDSERKDSSNEDHPSPYARQKEIIIKNAIDLFFQKGYAETSITDIINNAGVGRSTYYQLFPNKEELFLECADRVFYELYSHDWEKIKKETDMVKRLEMRLKAFIKSYPKWSDMMNILKGMAAGNNEKGLKKYKEILRQITRPIARDVDRAVRQKLVKKMDSTMTAYMLLGAADYCARLYYEKGYTLDEILRYSRDLIFNGIRDRP